MILRCFSQHQLCIAKMCAALCHCSHPLTCTFLHPLLPPLRPLLSSFPTGTHTPLHVTSCTTHHARNPPLLLATLPTLFLAIPSSRSTDTLSPRPDYITPNSPSSVFPVLRSTPLHHPQTPPSPSHPNDSTRPEHKPPLAPPATSHSIPLPQPPL